MVKNFLKEIIIMLLLILATILILLVLMYNYAPNNKVIPEQVSYVQSEEVKKELSEGSTEDNLNDILGTYSITEEDLTNYKKVKDYVPGKKNPFSALQTEGNTTGGNTANSQNGTNNKTNSGTSNTTGNSNTTNNTKTNTGQNDTGYIPDKGTK